MKTMESVIGLTAVIFIVFVLSAAGAQTEEKREALTVKSAEETNGVVFITGQGEKAPVELQCNKGFTNCNTLKPGGYVMVRLPKNRGMYECANVTVYAKPDGSAANSEELGRYCISE